MAVHPFRLAWILSTAALSIGPVFAAAEGCKVGVLAELPVTMTGTRPMISAQINGQEARFLVDSGAFFSLISGPGAAQYKLDTQPAPFNLMLEGIGGSRRAELTTVKEFTLAGIPIRKVQFLVGGSSLGNGAVGVLGQNLLRIADVEYDLAHGVIRLMKPENCKKLNMAYWAKPGDPYSEMEIDWATAGQPHTTGTAWLNGKKIRVMLDTGASTSMLSRSAAERAGVTPDSPGVVKSGRMRGIGSRAVDTWIAPFESFKIGDEEIRNTKLRIGDTSLEQDMLVGADFFLSHRIYVASSQRKMYFTFNGGPVFNLADRPPPGAEPDDEAPKTADAPQPEVPEGTPTDAAGFSRRGAAFAARRDYAHALEDLTRACELAPAEPEYFYERGRAYLGNRQPAMAVADFDQVIRLKPDHVPALVTRAGMNMARLDAGQRFDATAVLADLNKASASAPKEDDVHLELGTLYSRLGAFGPAIAQYDMWLDTHPTEARTPEAYASRCRSRAMMGLELDKALSDCNRAVRAHDDAPFFLDSRGMVHLRMGNYDKAIADYDAALKIQPKNPWALYGRGLAELKKGRKAEGEAQIAAAKAAAPRIVAEAERRGLIP
jgi:tetratricopeptide (TPR) repeat protein/predicted aspartyl protease